MRILSSPASFGQLCRDIVNRPPKCLPLKYFDKRVSTLSYSL